MVHFEERGRWSLVEVNQCRGPFLQYQGPAVEGASPSSLVEQIPELVQRLTSHLHFCELQVCVAHMHGVKLQPLVE